MTKLWTHLILAGLLATLLMACGDLETGGTDNNLQPDGEGVFDNTFFKVVEEEAPNTVIVGVTDLTLSNGQLSGTLDAYDDSGDFPGVTGQLSGTLEAGQIFGDKQSYSADLTLDFDGDAPDYTASGQVYTVDRGDEEVIFTEQPIALSQDGSRVGKFILAERDSNDGDDGDNGDDPQPGTPPEGDQTFEDTSFRTNEVASPYNVVIEGTTDLTLSDGQLSGTLDISDDSRNFPGGTGTLSGTLEAGETDGDTQSYTADLTLDFDGDAPDYTASGQVFTVERDDEQVIFTQEPLELSQDGSSVGEFTLGEDDGNGDGGDDGETPQPGNPSGDDQTFDDTFFKTVEVVSPYNVIVGEGDLTLSNGQLSGTLSAYDDSGDFPSVTGTLSGTLEAGETDGDRQSYTANLTLDFEGDAPDYTASGRVYTVDRGDEQVIFTQDPMELDKDGSRVGKFILAEQDD